MTGKFRARFLRWSRHVCPTLPASTPVRYDLPCRCGWRVAGVLFAATDGDLLARIGAPTHTHDLSGPLRSFLDHYASCPSATARPASATSEDSRP